MRSRSPPADRRVDPRDSDSFPWLRVIVVNGDLTENIDPEAWDHVPVDRFKYERLPDLNAFAMQVRPWPDQTVGDVKKFAARSFGYYLGTGIRLQHWHMEKPDGSRVDQDTPVWEVFEQRGDSFLCRHEADTPRDNPDAQSSKWAGLLCSACCGQ